MKRLLPSTLVCISVLTAQIRLPNPQTWKNNYIGSNVRRYDVVMQYGASGMKTTTTLSATSGSTSATVGSCSTFYKGQGFYIIGAGTTGAIFVDSVVSCTGTTLTWNTATSTTVTGATVGHEDHASINAAIADAFNNGGGEVFFPSSGTDGVYNCFVLNPVTGGCITFPQNLAYIDVITVMLTGESLGVLTQTTGLAVQSGAAIDCHLAPNVATVGSAPNTGCVIPAPYVTATNGNLSTVWLPVNLVIDNLLFFLPNQTKLNGLMLNNVMQAKVGNNVYVVSQPDSVDTWSQPSGTGPSCLQMPQFLNNILETVGSMACVGFNVGISTGEHTRFNQPTIQFANYCLALEGNEHIVSGEVDCEFSGNWIFSSSGGANSIVNTMDLTMDGEVTPSGGEWWVRGAQDILDTGNYLYGILRYSFYVNVTGGYATVVKSGASHLQTCNLSAAPVTTSGVPTCAQ